MPAVPIDRQVTVPVTGLRIHVREWGGPGRYEGGRLPVVLVHGLASTCHIYDLCAPLLAPTRRVIAYDQRGHGATARPAEGYDTATFVADGRGLVQALGLEEPYIVVGHSWGATIALHWAIHAPASVEAVVLVDGAFFPWHETPGASWERVRRRLAPPDLTGLSLATMLERMRATFGFLEDEMLQAYVRAILEETLTGAVRARLPRETHLRILRTLWDEDVDAAFHALHRPALALLATQEPSDAGAQQRDAARRAMVARIQGMQPLLQVRWLADTIHDVPLQRPGVLADAVEGLS